ncbi:MAG: hydantoin racemase [Candidatus Bathyarchaeota archaeon]|nr:MAG: hydantoin racemase [Candidatus Bathyarchaeota archaeon]
MTTRILWINPLGTDLFDQPIQEFLETANAPDTEIDVISLKRGPMHLEYHYYEALILADTLHQVRRAEKEGYDAAVIGCFYDPGLREAREISEHLVVTAPAEASMHIATTLGHTFSIIVGRNKWIPKMHENVVKYGFREQLASFKVVDLGVHDFQKDKGETERRLRAAAKEAVEKDRAEVIILGCTIEFGFYQELQEELKAPVIDAALAPLKYAEFLVELKKRLNWGQSKIYGYQSPPEDEIAEWKIEEQYGLENIW